MSTPPHVSETSQTPRSTLFFRPANPQTPRSPALEPAACPIASYPAVSGTSRPAAAKARAKVNWQDQGALRQKISQRARHPSAHRPLRAIAVAIRLRRVLVNRAIPRNAAEARECLAQNFFLQPQLLCGGNMLIVAPAALLEMRTAWLAAFCRRKNDLEQVRPEEFLLPLLDSRAHFFSGQDVGHKNRVSVGVRQAIASDTSFSIDNLNSSAINLDQSSFESSLEKRLAALRDVKQTQPWQRELR